MYQPSNMVGSPCMLPYVHGMYVWFDVLEFRRVASRGGGGGYDCALHSIQQSTAGTVAMPRVL